MLVHNANGYGLFTGGLGFHHGAERLGATILPVSSGQTARQIMLLRDLAGAGPVLHALLRAHARRGARGARGSRPRRWRSRSGCSAASRGRSRCATQLERRLGLRARNFYGLSEIIGPGVAAECDERRRRSHINEDHFLAEVVDRGGPQGELVITTLTKEALPLIRYRTGDIAALTEAPCACGRTLARMGPVRGRRDDMLILRGVNVYPSEIEHVLLGIEGVEPHYELTVERPGPPTRSASAARRAPATARPRGSACTRRCASAPGSGSTSSSSEPGALPRSEGKAARVIDRRKSGDTRTD